jgi:hypothetical protein
MERRIRRDQKSIPRPFDGLEGGGDILGSPDFKFGEFNGEGAGRGLNLAHSAHGVGIANVGQDRQTAETRENLASP